MCSIVQLLYLSITNIMFEHKGIHNSMWHQDKLGCRLIIDFVAMFDFVAIFFGHLREGMS